MTWWHCGGWRATPPGSSSPGLPRRQWPIWWPSWPAAGPTTACCGSPTGRVARQLRRAVAGSGAPAEPVDEWMLDWLARTADLLVGQAPGVAAELLTRAVASTSADSARHGRLASRLADALYRLGDRA